MKKYVIELSTYAADKSAAQVISEALGFKKELSHGTLIDIFAGGAGFQRHKNGVFTSKKSAQIVARAINERGWFGGYGKFSTGATVVAI